MTLQMKQSPPLVSNHRKEERPSGNIGSSIVWHFQRLSKVTCRSYRTGIEVGQAPACRLWKPMIAAAGGSLPFRDWSLSTKLFNNGHESFVQTPVTEICTENFITSLSCHRSLHPSASQHSDVECQCVESRVREGSVPGTTTMIRVTIDQVDENNR